MRHLGIDYGTKRVGISTSDETGQMAFPEKVLANDNKLIENIGEILQTKNVGKIVMGESKNFKMEDNEVMKDIMDLKSVLEATFEKDVVLHPEVLTSAQAENIQGKNNMLDASAATIILQSYLDLQKSKSENN
jgi:putative Holliday junction resolvase